jgi:hypothetical protein
MGGTIRLESRSLKMDVSSPHLGVSGDLYPGFFEGRISDQLAKCMWGADPALLAQKMEIEIYDSDSGVQAATVLTGYRDKMVYFNAYNFHYSTNQISVTSKYVEAEKSTIAKFVKFQIKCRKGTKTRTIINRSAVCPNGFKRISSKRIL